MDDLKLPRDLRRCIAFHGHLCPGVVTGYCASLLGMRELDVGRSEDEKLITIVENDTCAVDAVQVLTGCTFGKGNLFFRDHGKMVFTFATRRDGRSVRVRRRPNGLPLDEDLPEAQRRRERIEFMLSRDPSELFDIRQDILSCLPETARIHESAPCDRCGEMVMCTRLRRRGPVSLCIPCDDAARMGRFAQD